MPFVFVVGAPDPSDLAALADALDKRGWPATSESGSAGRLFENAHPASKSELLKLLGERDLVLLDGGVIDADKVPKSDVHTHVFVAWERSVEQTVQRILSFLTV